MGILRITHNKKICKLKNKDIVKKQNKSQLVVIIFCFCFCILTGCKKEKDYKAEINEITKEAEITNTTIPTVTLEPTPTIDIAHEGMARSYLTGEWISKEESILRPYAVMFNNIKVASPQSGIKDADILYEALVEGGITRLMGIYGKIEENSKTADRIGSVRSARHYYASIASEYDAILIHFGQTSYAAKKIKKLKLDHLSGTDGYGVNSFYRDKLIKAPHNAFASLNRILKGIEKGKFRTQLKENYIGQFQFYEEDNEISDGQAANKVTLPFSSGMQPYFTYDEAAKLYTRYQFGTVHTDYNTKEALTFKNIIIQIVKEWDIDKNGYQTMDLEDAAGKGYYITNGKGMPITWKKKESTYFMRYYDEKGEVLTINPGKTYIAVFPDFRSSKIEIE